MKPVRQKLRALVVTSAVSGTVFGAGLAGPARANHTGPNQVACGSTLTTAGTYQLTSNLGPCLDGGIIINGNNITLDLKGYTISGTTADSDDAAVLDAAGVLILNSTGVRVTDSTPGGGGTITRFDAGVAIVGGSGNTVEKLTIKYNIGDIQSTYGDGVYISGSSTNTITLNTVSNNGPYAGVGVYSAVSSTCTSTSAGVSNGNTISQNVIRDNDVPPTSLLTNQTDGVRIEPCSTNTTISNNTVEGGAFDGIAVFPLATGAQITGNTVKFNGGTVRTNYLLGGAGQLISGEGYHRKGDGIKLFGRANNATISGNTVCGNAGNGISLGNEANPPRPMVPVKDSTISNNVVGTGTAACPKNHAATVNTTELLSPQVYFRTYEMNDVSADPATNTAATNCGNLAAGGGSNNWTANTTHAYEAPNLVSDGTVDATYDHRWNHPCTSKP